MRASVIAGVDTPPVLEAFRRDAVSRHGFAGDGQSMGFVADQDISIGTTQQAGLNSRGFKGCILTHQEKRIQRFHEKLNDIILGGPTS